MTVVTVVTVVIVCKSDHIVTFRGQGGIWLPRCDANTFGAGRACLRDGQDSYAACHQPNALLLSSCDRGDRDGDRV